MGRIKRGILGGFSGKVANIVGSSWKGIAVIKSLPLSVANPRTAAQVAQRSDFSKTVALASIFLSLFVKVMWDRFAVQMSGYNAFIQKNIGLVSDVAGETYKDFIPSSGKMDETLATDTNLVDGSASGYLEWVDDSGQGLKLATDQAHMLMFGDDLSKIVKSIIPNTRNTGVLQFTMNEAVVTGERYFYTLAFIRADGTVVSNSRIHEITVT